MDVSSIAAFPWSTIPLVEVISIPMSLAFGSTLVGNMITFFIVTCIAYSLYKFYGFINNWLAKKSLMIVINYPKTIFDN